LAGHLVGIVASSGPSAARRWPDADGVVQHQWPADRVRRRSRV